MTLVHRSQSSARLLAGSQLENDNESCTSLTLLPLRRSTSSAAVLHSSTSVHSLSAVVSLGGSGSGSSINLRRKQRKSPFKRQKQKLCLIFCFMVFFHRQALYEALSPIVGRIINLFTLYLIYQTPNTVPNSLWKASTSATTDPMDNDDTLQQYSIDLVVSHCNLPIDWIFSPSFLTSFKFRNVTIISKCNQPVIGAPSTAKIIQLPNVGRCDHSYAHYMANYQQQDYYLANSDNKTRVVLFLKDNDNKRRAVYSRPRTLPEMLRITKEFGFACHEERIWTPSRRSTENSIWQVLRHPICHLSSYYNYSMLQNMEMRDYKRLERDRNDLDQFTSLHGLTLGAYAKTMKIDTTLQVVPVCYGGNFMTLAKQLPPQQELFHRMEKSLNRASNVAEGHFVERLWATILSFPLNTTQRNSLIQMATTKQPPCNAGPKFIGVLTKY